MASRLLPQPAFFRALRQSSFTFPVRPEFLTSTSAKYVNPRGHVFNTDKVVQTFPASVVSGLSDERVLALFTSGFFGGFIFGIERFVLRIGGYNILPARYTDAVTIWKLADLPNTHLLPLGSCLFGSFRMLDKHIAKAPSVEEPSYVDYGFGSDEFNFAGCHRFLISRLPAEKEKEPEIRLELHHFRCNPSKNQPSAAEPMERFHYLYAKALFANAVQAVLLR